MAETGDGGTYMLAELDVVVFLKSNDDINTIAQRVFGSLKSDFRTVPAEEVVGQIDDEDLQEEIPQTYFGATGLGFNALLFPNSGIMLDPEFEAYHYGLEITSQFWCVELDTLDLEGPLSEYFARQLAFDLNVETATEVLLETTEEAEIFEIRSFRRNPQYRLDQSPTTPKVFVVEARRVEETFEDDEWEGDEFDETVEAVGEGEAP